MSDITSDIKAGEASLESIMNKKFVLDYFQRGYRWQTDHVKQMVNDLIQEFDCQFIESNRNHAKANGKYKFINKYSTYFMGTIVLYPKEIIETNDTDEKWSVIDGQQRLTSLTLLLIYLKHKIKDFNSNNSDDIKSKLDNLICSNDCGEISFNISVEERKECLKSLYDYGNYDYKSKDNNDKSIISMVDRYLEIDKYFPVESEEWYIAFAYWLIKRVKLVEIQATSEDKAYIIFESMNNRGLSLTNTEMLNGFILSKFTNNIEREDFKILLEENLTLLDEYKKRRNEKIDDAFYQAWLKSQFAETFRQNKRGSDNGDMENINTRFHNWFKDNYNNKEGLLGKAIDNNMENFMKKNYKFYFKWFLYIKKAEKNFPEELKEFKEFKELKDIYYINNYSIAESLKYPLLLAPLMDSDTPEIVIKKLKLVAKYIDGFAVRYSVSSKRFGYSYIDYRMNSLVIKIRNKSVEELKKILSENLKEAIRENLKETLCENLKDTDNEHSFQNWMYSFRLHKQNKTFVKYFLCRLTTYIEESCECGNNFVKYFTNPDCEPFEIEHNWSNHFDRHKDEFEQENEFDEWRNRIGALVLLPKSTNGSFLDETFEKKVEVYIGKNIPYITQSLSNLFYRNNPKFNRFYTNFDLKFKSYGYFNKESIKERCKLYADLADKIWSITLD